MGYTGASSLILLLCLGLCPLPISSLSLGSCSLILLYLPWVVSRRANVSVRRSGEHSADRNQSYACGRGPPCFAWSMHCCLFLFSKGCRDSAVPIWGLCNTMWGRRVTVRVQIRMRCTVTGTARGRSIRLIRSLDTCRYDLMYAIEGFQRVKLAWRPADLVACLSRLEFPVEIRMAPMVFAHSKRHAEDS